MKHVVLYALDTMDGLTVVPESDVADLAIVTVAAATPS